MLSPPEGLPESRLIDAIAECWGVTIASIGYRAVGFGSHHWVATDAGETRWFITVDDLTVKRHAIGEPSGAAFERLRSALASARELERAGNRFVVAPVPALSGEPLVRLGPRFAVAVYPFVDGQSYCWGEALTPELRRELLKLIVALHSTAMPITSSTRIDDFTVPHRDVVELLLSDPRPGWTGGPYGEPTVQLVAKNAQRVRRLLSRYDTLVAAVRRDHKSLVPTHGEPHPGNVMLTATGLRLIDWDTALMAPPERDLWILDPDDGSTYEAYAAATARMVRREAIDLYRVRWDVADLGTFLARFHDPHPGNRDDDQSWRELAALVEQMEP
jgi:spectinomycin phosphotransferase/16S rRNA (guanine(1405)-N(7))-methyltransferase